MDIKKEGDTVTITAKLDNGVTSSTGKSTILFSSHGFQWAQGLGINLIVIQSKR